MNSQSRAHDMLPIVLAAAGALLLIAALALFYWVSSTPANQVSATTLLEFSQRGRFLYKVRMRPNNLYPDAELGPGQTYFLNLIDDVPMTFAYELTSDQPLDAATFEYQVDATVGSPDVWEKRLVLVPPTITAGNFTVAFSLPIQEIVALLNAIREETGVTLNAPRITVTARVQPQAQSPYGPVNDGFQSSMFFTIDGNTMRASEMLEQVQQGSIVDTQSMPTPRRATAAVSAGIGLLLGIVLLVVALVLWLGRRNAEPKTNRQLQKARKKHKGVLVETTDLPARQANQIVVHVNTLNDLLELAEEMFRPVLYSSNSADITYCVFDEAGVLRYEFHDSSGDKETAAGRAA